MKLDYIISAIGIRMSLMVIAWVKMWGRIFVEDKTTMFFVLKQTISGITKNPACLISYPSEKISF